MEYASLRETTFPRFWCGRVATTMANQIFAVLLGWQIYDLTHSALALGLIGLVQFVPTVTLMIAVGHVADRYDRKRVAMVCESAAAAVVAVVVTALALHAVTAPLLYVAGFIVGVARSFEAPSLQALMPNLVSRLQLPRAMALNTSANRVAVISGPALGGLLFAISPVGVYVLIALLYLTAAAFVFSTRPERTLVNREPPTLRSLFAGVAYVLANPLILGAISLDLFAVIFGGATALLPIFTRDILGVGAFGLGLLRAAPAAGSIAVGFILARYPLRRHVGPTLFAMIALFGVFTIAFAYSRNFALSFLALALTGTADVISVVIRVTLIQLDTPDEMRGRVTAVNSMFTNSSNQLGEFESGVVAAWLGAVPSAALGGLGCIAVALLWMRLFPRLAKADRFEEATG